jgi:hypothetical protein
MPAGVLIFNQSVVRPRRYGESARFRHDALTAAWKRRTPFSPMCCT